MLLIIPVIVLAALMQTVYGVKQITPSPRVTTTSTPTPTPPAPTPTEPVKETSSPSTPLSTKTTLTTSPPTPLTIESTLPSSLSTSSIVKSVTSSTPNIISNPSNGTTAKTDNGKELEARSDYNNETLPINTTDSSGVTTKTETAALEFSINTSRNKPAVNIYIIIIGIAVFACVAIYAIVLIMKRRTYTYDIVDRTVVSK